jgi:hypothetical protein
MRNLSLNMPIERKLDEAYSKWGRKLGLQQQRNKRLKKIPVPNIVPFTSNSLEPLRHILSKCSHGAFIVTNDEHPHFTFQASTYSASFTRLTLKSELDFCKNEMRYYPVLVVQQFNIDQWENGDAVMQWLRDHGGHLGFEKLVYQCPSSPKVTSLARSNGLKPIHHPFVENVLGIQREGGYYCYLEKQGEF